MGQQQLLLLVLSTVIVGLATVAGIQAFSENQQQATQDALVQRSLTMSSDILAAHQKPSQFGGGDITAGNPGDLADAAGLTGGNGSGKDIPAEGVGDNAQCDISISNNVATIACSSTSDNSYTSGTNQYVEVDVDPNAAPDSKISDPRINSDNS